MVSCHSHSARFLKNAAKTCEAHRRSLENIKVTHRFQPRKVLYESFKIIQKVLGNIENHTKISCNAH